MSTRRRLPLSLSFATIAGLLASAACLERPADVEWDASLYDAMPIDAEIVLDPAMLVSSQGPHDFTDVTVDGASEPLRVIVRNAGEQPSGALTVTLAGDDAAAFAIVPSAQGDDCFGAILDPLETCAAEVRFEPTAAGPHSARLEVGADPGGVVTVDLAGNGLTAGDLVFTAGATLDFAAVEIEGTSALQTVTVQNSGGTPTASLTVTLGDTTNYTTSNDTCNGQPLGAGLSCSVSVRFHPITVGTAPTQLSVRESPTVGVAASITGTGTARLQITTPSGGTVTSDPSGLACGPTCGPVSFSQTPVVLTAAATLGYEFATWTGACAGTVGDTCSVALTDPLVTAGATFTALDCVPNVVECNDAAGVYTDCGPTGEIEVQMTCPLGCSTTSEQCVDVNPSNGLATYLDMAADGPDVVFAGAGSINTNTGAVTGANVAAIPNFVVGMGSGVPQMRVFVVKSLTISGALRVTGTQSLGFVADRDVAITGVLDASGDRAGLVAGPGTTTGNGCPGAVSALNVVNPSAGGGGGGRYEMGAAGGAAGNGEAGGAGGAALTGNTLIPLHGGCSGGAVIESIAGSVEVPDGGPGGGAVQLVSRTGIFITGSGKVDVSGAGGPSFPASSGAIAGTGGGSGGAVLLEAPQVVLDGSSVVISAKGGAGAAAGNGGAGHHGADGGTAAGAAAGGTNAGNASGGQGGTEVVAPTAGANGASSTLDGGGGGGSVGYARLNTATGIATVQNGAVIRSRSTVGTVATRLVP